MYALEAAAAVVALFLFSGVSKLVSGIMTGARGSGKDPPLRLKLCLSYKQPDGVYVVTCVS